MTLNPEIQQPSKSKSNAKPNARPRSGRGHEDHARRPAARRSGRTQILIVEDNRDAATMLRELLALEGHEAVVASTGDRALALARELEPEVVLCDLGLPDTDGYSLAAALRAALGPKRVTLIAVTGHARAEDQARARAAGFDEHLAKPVDLATLSRVLSDDHRARAGSRTTG